MSDGVADTIRSQSQSKTSAQTYATMLVMGELDGPPDLPRRAVRLLRGLVPPGLPGHGVFRA
jgi:hypothetical protein